jgi:hypothetical protein
MKTVDYPADKGTRITGIIGILAGVFVIIYFIMTVLTLPPATPDQQLSSFNANQTAYALLGVAAALFATSLIAFAGGFSMIVRQKSPSVSSAAAFLAAIGALLVAIGDNLYVGGLFAISAGPSTASYSNDAAYFAAILYNFTDNLPLNGSLLAGIGLLLFAWVIWNGEIFPRWLSYVLLVGGVLGILVQVAGGILGTFAPITLVFVIGLFVVLAVWGFVAGIVLFRAKPTTAEPAK